LAHTRATPCTLTKKNAPVVPPKYGWMPDSVENRWEEESPDDRDFTWGRKGTGDHSAGAAMRYNPIMGELYLQKHQKKCFTQQMYGFIHERGVYVVGRRDEILRRGPEVGNGDDCGVHEGSLRPCGESMISAFISHKGSTCARMSKDGAIEKWRLIESRISLPPGYPPERHGREGTRMTRLATLGSPESEAKCGKEARFLMGYEFWDELGGMRRWLLELNGDCEPVSDPMDVTAHTMWPPMQEWTTTRDGAVVWATAYPEGKYWPNLDARQPQFKDEDTYYPPRPEKSFQSKEIFASPQASQWAQVSVYWPSGKMLGRESFPPGPAPMPPTPAPDPPNRRRRQKDSRRRRRIESDK